MINAFSFSNAKIRRLSILAELQEKLKTLEGDEERLKQELMKSAPVSVRTFLRNEDAISDLLKFGQSSRKIYYANNLYHMHDADTVRKCFTALETAWNGAVRVSFTQEDHRIEVLITAT